MDTPCGRATSRRSTVPSRPTRAGSSRCGSTGPRGEVTLTDFDPEGEIKVVAAALYVSSRLPDDQLLAVARKLGPEERRRVLEAYVGTRANRRHKPGRAFERTSYRFDVLGDYGAFRDLQRHRMLTIEWQKLSPRHGYEVPAPLVDAGYETHFDDAMERSAALHDVLVDKFPDQ